MSIIWVGVGGLRIGGTHQIQSLTRRNIHPSKHKTMTPGLNNPLKIDLISDGTHKKIFPKRSDPGSCDDICWSLVACCLILPEWVLTFEVLIYTQQELLTTTHMLPCSAKI